MPMAAAHTQTLTPLRMTYRVIALCMLALALPFAAFTQHEPSNTNTNKFRQLGQELPTPNVYRAASGAPGHQYWQQQADYDIQVTVDDAKQVLQGEETITYYNNSPDRLEYIWLQLDQNMRAKDSDTYKIRTGKITNEKLYFNNVRDMEPWFDGGFKLEGVTTPDGTELPHTVNKTMMRIDLPTVLEPGANVSFKVKWWYNINDRMKIGGRSGYEYFEEDDNYLYTLAQFYPRMAVYDDVNGWQHKQFLGRGEFALTFGNYKVAITVPSDHVVAATGTCSNLKELLTSDQYKRWEDAANNENEPTIIVTQKEAEKAEKNKASDTKTWVFEAENVRDFGFATSRKFIWDAMAVKFGDRTVLAQSYYPKEGNPLWEQYSTRAVAHTIRTYSKFTFDYPYPQATSVHAASIGMEYPMICFNFGRPNKDGTYSERLKYRMIGVIIHEVGHNFFPMIVNSDERQWTWMDEGLNTFVQYLTEQEWDRDYPSRRGNPSDIVNYMKGDKQFISPIMTNSESIFQFGNNAYGKPCTALNILRETIMGRELFDKAFKTYCQRWMFKHPSPADFFRTMEDASAVDLDWFWRGWFYTTDHCDISVDRVTWYKVDSKNPAVEFPRKKAEEAAIPDYTRDQNQEAIDKTLVERDAGANDWYNEHNKYEVLPLDTKEYNEFLKKLEPEERAMLTAKKNYYEITFKNIGGLVMPLILDFEYTDGSVETRYIPAEIWKMNAEEVTKVFVTTKEVKQISLDPRTQTADCDMNNNYWPAKMQPTRFEIFKERKKQEEYNRMQRANGTAKPKMGE